MILSHGHEGPSAVSDIIASFGSFVVGGNYVIGVIVFAILVIINFIVITNGSTRVAEVSARFTLDAMPGKQMAIDAELNSGMIEQKEAKERRDAIVAEANFYGAMDGSSKFVKGDAIAGIIITIINIVGGILIGVFYHGMTIANSAQTFTILTIGDGLVSQIPALLVSTATGIIITRGSTDDKNFAQESVNQLAKDYKVLLIVGGILLLFASVPGLPAASLMFVGFFFVLSALLVRNSQDNSVVNFLMRYLPFLASNVEQKKEEQIKEKLKKTVPYMESPEDVKARHEKSLEEAMKTEIIRIDLGSLLQHLIQKGPSSDLMQKISSQRTMIAKIFGFILPDVFVRTVALRAKHTDPEEYIIYIKNVLMGRFKVKRNHVLAIKKPDAIGELEGFEKVKEPVYGMDAFWVPYDRRVESSSQSYTNYDISTVIAQHLYSIVVENASEFLTRQDVNKLLDMIAIDHPVIVDEIKEVTNLSTVQMVLRDLLEEQIPIKDIVTILETVSDFKRQNYSIETTVEGVRTNLARTITEKCKGIDNKILAIGFSPETEQKVTDKLAVNNGNFELQWTFEQIDSFLQDLKNAKEELLSKGFRNFILLTPSGARRRIYDFCKRTNIDIMVVSVDEIYGGDNVIEFVAHV